MSDVLALFLADLNRAADGLKQSLALGSTGSFHASLHARDLGDALYGVDLRRHAELAIDISRHLAKGLPGLDQPAKNLIAVVADACEKIAAGVAPGDLPQDSRLSEITQALSAFEDERTESETSSFDEPLALTQQQEEEEQVFVWQGAPAPEIRRIAANQDQAGHVASTSNQHSLNGLAEQKIFVGLASVKAIEQELESFLPADAARRTRYALSDHANWLIALRQFPLQRLLADHCERISVLSAAVDAEIARLLRQALDGIGPIQEISGSVQQMTVFLKLNGVPDSQQASSRLTPLMQSIHGRIEQVAGGFELVFPSSLKRLRVVPFRRNGQLFAVSWAQFLSAQTLQGDPASVEGIGHEMRDGLGVAEGARLLLQFKSGQQTHRLFVSEVRHFEIANASRFPNLVRTEPWVCGLLIGQDSEPAIWLDPERL